MENARCCFCQKDAESVLHVLWGCGVAQDVWAGSSGRFQKSCIEQDDFSQPVLGLMSSFQRRNGICFGLFVGRYGISGTQLCMGVHSSIL